MRLWGGLALRVFLLLLIILALAGIQLRLPSHTLTAVFVLDVSDSIPPADQARGEEFIRQAIEAMPRGDQAAIVVFGEDALVERLASEESVLARLTSVPITTRTDIASALQLAMALFPDEGARRLVLLSDGRENLSIALQPGRTGSVSEYRAAVCAPGGSRRTRWKCWWTRSKLRRMCAKASSLTWKSPSRAPRRVGATLRVFADGELIQTQELNLQAGANRYTVPVKDAKPGFHRFRAQIAPDADNRLQNNEASAFTVVHGPPSILMVEGQPGEGPGQRSGSREDDGDGHPACRTARHAARAGPL